jgi:hypothetical protein
MPTHYLNYSLLSGTDIGEVKNEIYCKYGETIMSTAHYGWHHEHINDNTYKMYNMVNTDPVQFLIATVTLNRDKLMPFCIDSIEINWVNTNTPFLPKADLDAQGIPYIL